jgi:hypothetical protein
MGKPAHLFRNRLAAVVDGLRPALHIDPRQIVRGCEILAEIADPSRAAVLDGIDFARADGIVGGLQQRFCILGSRWPNRRPQRES